jgi:hypothetical protein
MALLRQGTNVLSANTLGETERGYHTKYFDQYPLLHASRPFTPTPTWPKRCAIAPIITTDQKMSKTKGQKNQDICNLCLIVQKIDFSTAENKPDKPHENTENTYQNPNNTHSPSPPQPNYACSSSPSRPNVPLNHQLKDVFDGQHYRHLCYEWVTIPSESEEGFKPLKHLYFEDEQDVALGLALDGFTFYKTLGKSAQKTKYNTWALIMINYNLNPTIRTHRKHVIPLGMIPGPGSPKHIGSFLYWLHRELIRLAKGVCTYDHLD